ncbi:MAG TPA: hypothetical protein ENI65_08425 [Gammaproteobacteria bacterium]|nr:hypothetical protein [Gammaproteobacteria bacterium]
MRLLLLIIALGLGIAIIKHLLSAKGTPPARENPPTAMVRCQQCGVHIPEEEAFHEDKLFFCSDEHRSQYRS